MNATKYYDPAITMATRVRAVLDYMPRPEAVFKAANCGEVAMVTASYLRRELRSLPTDVMVQAGSAGWMTSAVSDGKPVEFAYEFEPDDQRTAGWVRRGWMPEMHAWVAVRDGDGWVIVDPSRRYLPEASTTDYGYLGEAVRWPADWAAGGDFIASGTGEECFAAMKAAGCRYVGCGAATAVLVSIWSELLARPGKAATLSQSMDLYTKWLRTVHEPMPVLDRTLYGGRKCPFRAFRARVNAKPHGGGDGSDG